MKKLLIAALALCLLGAGSAGWYASGIYRTLHTAVAERGEARVFSVGGGEALGSVLTRMRESGLLAPGDTRRWLMRYASYYGLDRRVKSGEYDLAPTQTPVELLESIVEGRAKTYAVTIPEGLRSDEIAARLAAAQLTDAAEFLEAVRNSELAASLGIEADSLEGYLYPETYRFERGASAERIARRMVEELRAQLTEKDRADIDASELSLHEIVTLASIVEKETGAAFERPRIAAVFHNRLRIGMRLQSDPTVIYGVLVTKGEFDGNIRRRDLETDTAYNTYTRRGIPPGPIASPGIDAIRAVLAPEDVDYLYFVSKNDGTHVFNKRHSDHVAAVNRYQRRR